MTTNVAYLVAGFLAGISLHIAYELFAWRCLRMFQRRLDTMHEAHKFLDENVDRFRQDSIKRDNETNAKLHALYKAQKLTFTESVAVKSGKGGFAGWQPVSLSDKDWY
jgi:hypothetical protein